VGLSRLSRSCPGASMHALGTAWALEGLHTLFQAVFDHNFRALFLGLMTAYAQSLVADWSGFS
jgi:hypothetical protein